MFFNLFNYKLKAETNKAKIIKRDTKYFKKLCLKQFKSNIKRGLTITIVDFSLHSISHDFQEEISKLVLKELQQENKNIEFSFSWRHYQNSYKGIKMVAL